MEKKYKVVEDNEYKKALQELSLQEEKKEIEAASDNLHEALVQDSDNLEEESMQERITLKYSDIDEIILDKKSLTGMKLRVIEREWRKTNKGVLIKELDDSYLAQVAAAMCEHTYEEIINLNAADYKKVVREVSDFLLDS